jgi:hypothetical protein
MENMRVEIKLFSATGAVQLRIHFLLPAFVTLFINCYVALLYVQNFVQHGTEFLAETWRQREVLCDPCASASNLHCDNQKTLSYATLLF